MGAWHFLSTPIYCNPNNYILIILIPMVKNYAPNEYNPTLKTSKEDLQKYVARLQEAKVEDPIVTAFKNLRYLHDKEHEIQINKQLDIQIALMLGLSASAITLFFYIWG